MKKKYDIKCDNSECDWSTKDDVKKWHNKKCPKCKKCVIITDEDMNIFHSIELLKRMGIAKSPDSAKECILVHIDTARLRDDNL